MSLRCEQCGLCRQAYSNTCPCGWTTYTSVGRLPFNIPGDRIDLVRRDRTIRELQSNLPWTAHYHRDFRSNPQTHKDFAHALLHIHKAGGKLAAIIDDAEHAGFDWTDPDKRAEAGKYVADMVICALRMATTCPDGQLDLQRLVEDRLASKNNQLAAMAPGLAAGERAL